MEFLRGSFFIFQTASSLFLDRETFYLSYGTVNRFLTMRTTGRGLSILIHPESTRAAKVSGMCCNRYDGLIRKGSAHDNERSVLFATPMSDRQFNDLSRRNTSNSASFKRLRQSEVSLVIFALRHGPFEPHSILLVQFLS